MYSRVLMNFRIITNRLMRNEYELTPEQLEEEINVQKKALDDNKSITD